MYGKRFLLMLKWAVFLVIIEYGLQYATIFIILVIVGLTKHISIDANVTKSLLIPSTIISQLIFIPFVYLFCYKAAKESFKKGLNTGLRRGYAGLYVSMGVALISQLIIIVVNYFLTGNFNFAVGVLPIIVGWIAGSKAEKRFSKK